MKSPGYSLTPGVGLGILHVSDAAFVFVTLGGCEGDALGQMKVPALLKGQVGLLGSWNLHIILHQFDVNVWGVEATHVADELVCFVKLPRVTAVNLDFW